MSVDQKTGKPFPRGAKPTPRYKLAATCPHRAVAAPPQVIVVPSFLEMWLNDQDGDCVTAEEAFAKAAYSVMSGQPETKITDATVLAFCNKYGVLNGANLPPVMDAMASDGFHQDGTAYTDGPYSAVDYSNEAILQSAIAIGPVKIGIDANALPSGAGNANGWYAFGGSPGQYSNEDHCTSLCGYGTAAALFAALNTPVPSTASPTKTYYLHYTWSTIGVVDHDWIMSTCGEAWVRNPTTLGIAPPPPPPPPPPGPTPSPDTVTIPSQTIPVSVSGTGPFGRPITLTGSITVSGGTYPVDSGTTSILLSADLVLALDAARGSELVGAPRQVQGTVNDLLTYIPVGAKGPLTITIPNWLLTGLAVLCALLPTLNLPSPWNTILPLLCVLIPPAPSPIPVPPALTRGCCG